MRTTDFAILGLVLMVVVAAAIVLSMSGPDAAIAQAQVGMALSPAGSVGLGWVLSLVLKVLLGGVAAGIVVGIVVWVREWARSRQQNGRWQSGPNAYWRRQSEPRSSISQDDLMKMVLLKALTGNQPMLPPSQPPAQDDEVIEW